MKISAGFLSPLLTILFLITFSNEAKACSMYKLTVDGKTMVGCNEDAWRTTSKIWFQEARNKNEFGAAFTGSRQVGPNLFVPQSGMNAVGLAYSRLASYFPKQNVDSANKRQITNEVDYLSDILHKCATVDDVKKYIDQFDHSIFIDDVFIYIDSSGRYLVVEPYNLILGDDPYYVLSNFCPSITENEQARQLDRYRNGEDFLKSHQVDATLSFCTALSDTMHVCRNRNGDGTLLTSIWDTKNGLVNLHFYHDYNSTVQFNVSDELAKGNHMIDVISLFPANSEFNRLIEYKTPFNTPILRILLAIIGGLLPFITLIFLLVFIRNIKSVSAYKVLIISSILNLLLAAYFFVLATNVNIYYFDVPYKDYHSNFISLSSYIPFLLLVLIIPTLALAVGFVKNEKSKTWVY